MVSETDWLPKKFKVRLPKICTGDIPTGIGLGFTVSVVVLITDTESEPELAT